MNFTKNVTFLLLQLYPELVSSVVYIIFGPNSHGYTYHIDFKINVIFGKKC